MRVTLACEKLLRYDTPVGRRRSPGLEIISVGIDYTPWQQKNPIQDLVQVAKKRRLDAAPPRKLLIVVVNLRRVSEAA